MRTLGGILLLAVLAALAATLWETRASETPTNRPITIEGDGYVSSDACRSCHPEQYQSWHDSYHQSMTQLASPESIHGNFEDVAMRLGSSSYRLLRDDDTFLFEYESKDGVREQAPIELVTGSHHMQVYWYSTGEERELAQVPFTWIKEADRFLPRGHTFLEPQRQHRHGELGRWNRSCVNCHTTGGSPGIQDGHNETSAREFGIACEACHGPAEAHVAANRSPLRRYLQRASDETDPTVVQPDDLDAKVGSEVCGHCHATWLFESLDDEKSWQERGYEYRPGESSHEGQFLFQPTHRDKDELVAQVMEQQPKYARGMFWPDGYPRTSGTEFNALIMSGCHSEGELSCMSCHTMHQKADDPRPRSEWANDQLGHGMDGDLACTQCHESYAEDISAHTHHAADSDGSRCYNCHMPYTSYGLLKGIRAHHITSPDITTELETGRPNACNLCHMDRPLPWTASWLEQWYATVPPTGWNEDQRKLAAGVVWATKADASVRALTAWHVGWAPARKASKDSLVPMLGLLMDDPYAAVRYIASRSLGEIEGYEDLQIDSIPGPRQRPSAALRVAQRFARQHPRMAARPELILQRAGRVDVRSVNRLLEERDRTPIHLLE